MKSSVCFKQFILFTDYFTALRIEDIRRACANLTKGGCVMTVPQIRYREYREQARHNEATELLGTQQLAETQRTNQANEAIREEANRINRYGIDVGAETARATAEIAAEASRYSADRHYDASVYSADAHTLASQYAADSSRAAAKYSADQSLTAAEYQAQLNSENVRYSADSSAAASRYSANASVFASHERTSNEYAQRQAELEFQRERTQFENNLKAQTLRLDQLNSLYNRRHTDADTRRIQAQTEQAIAATENMVKEYALRARAQNNADELNKANVLLTQMRTLESGIKSFDTFTQTIDRCINLIEEVLQ